MIIELTKHIKMIRPNGLPVYPYSNSLFIDDEIKTMIDSGSGGKAYADIRRESINLLFLTHYHFDHTNGMSFFPNAKKMVGQEEVWVFQNEANYQEARGYNRWQEIMGSEREETFSSIWKYPEDIPSQPVFKKIIIDGTFQDGDILDLGSTSVMTIHTPGHTRGHYAFFFPSEEILFSGDYDASNMGPWYGDAIADMDDIIKSVYKLIALKPRILAGSHRRIIDKGVEQALLDWLDIALQREDRILEYLVEPRTLDDIVGLALFKKWSRGDQHSLFWEKMMITRHLERLLKHGLIIKIDNDKYLCNR